MSETVKLLDQYGLLVIAALFVAASLFLGRWMIMRLDKEADEARKDRRRAQEDRDAFFLATQGFTQVVENHMVHDTVALEKLTKQNTESFNELIRVMERICVLVELPNKDY